MLHLLYLICFLGFIFPKSKVLFAFQLVTILIIFGGYNGDLDLNFYREQYYTHYVPTGFFQKFFSYLFIFFENCNFSFEIVHLLIVLFSVLLLSIIICKLTDKIAYVLLIVIIFPFFENGWQLKNCIAMSIILLALYWFYCNILSKEGSIFNYIIYILLLLLASQFHYVAVFFLSFLFINIKSNHLLIFCIFIDCLIIFFSRAIIEYCSKYMSSLNSYEDPISTISFLITALWQIIGTTIIYINSRKNNCQFNQFLIKGSFIMLLIIPFYEFSLVTMRLYKIWMVFAAIGFSYNNYSPIRCKLEKHRLIFNIYVIFSHVFYYIILPYLSHRDILFQILFNDNFFMNNFERK